MKFSLSSVLSLLFLGSNAVLAQDPTPVEATGILTVPKPLPTLPRTCLLQRPLCFTATTTVTSRCAKETIKDCPTAPIACPAVIRITTTEVPCKNDCCPRTPTHTVTAPCIGCVTRCVIPTETVTVTTGCGKPTIRPTFLPVPTLITETIAPLPTM
ncbi:hypothetical protein V8F20_007553 [Naviculisporaceae sp. PSN 640]